MGNVGEYCSQPARGAGKRQAEARRYVTAKIKSRFIARKRRETMGRRSSLRDLAHTNLCAGKSRVAAFGMTMCEGVALCRS